MRTVHLASLALAVAACTEDGGVRDPNGQFYFSTDLGPASPRLMGRDVVAVGDITYVVTARQLRIITGNIDSGFEQPRAIELHPDGPAGGQALVAGDGVLYVGDRFGISVFDLAAPAIPELVARVELAPGVARLVRSDSMLVAITHDNGLHIVDISDPRAPVVHGGVALTGSSDAVLGLDVTPSTAIASAPGALWFVDLVSGTTPTVTAQHALPLVGDFVRDDSLLYTGNDNELSIIDISNPQAPAAVGPANAPWRLYSVAPLIVDDRLFMADYELGDVYVLDISSPRSPTVDRVLMAHSDTIPNGYVQDMIFANRQIWQTHVGGMFSWVIDF